MSLRKENENVQNREKPNIKGDRCNILLLTYMYVLQCIPRGLAHAIPLVLQKRKITYTGQAGFSFIQYPYCLKLLWAPIVDSVYSKKIGRRKTWMVPTQFLIGLMLLILSMNVDDWLGSEDGTRRPKTQMLALTFFACILFASTQDIAVDGWALTILKKRNVGHQSTCNNLGMAISLFLAYVMFLLLNSKEFCNFFRSTPQDYGFIDYADFIFLWSVICLVSTTLIFIFKRDNSFDGIDESECKISLKESYQCMWRILKLKPVQKITLFMLTHQIAFGPVTGVAHLKLVDVGVTADTIALLFIPSLPIIIILPLACSSYLTGYRSMRTFFTLYTLRLMVGIMYGIFLFCTPHVKDQSENTFPTWYYWTMLVICNIENVVECSMWVSCGAFFSRISDPRFGGMYMTLFNTIIHVAIRWPVSLSLWLVDPLTISTCSEDKVTKMRTCSVIFDGFFTEIILGTIIGVIWLWWTKKQICLLENLNPSAWMIEQKPEEMKEKVQLNRIDG